MWGGGTRPRGPEPLRAGVFEGADLILSREIRLDHTTLRVRDKDGSPLWKYFLKTIPTGE